MHASKTYAVALSPDGCIGLRSLRQVSPDPQRGRIASGPIALANKSAEFVSVQAQVEVLHAVAHAPSRLGFHSRLGLTG
jgi:hypothetical protein